MYEAKKAVDNAKKKDNDSILVLQSIKSGLTLANAGLDVYGAANGAKSTSEASIGVSASFGSEKTKRTTNEEQHTVMGSGVSAGDNINITATGNEQKTDGNINVIGSEVRAGNDITLNANQDINVIGAVNTQHRDMDEKSSSSSIGVGVSVGTGGPGFTVSGSKSFTHERENANGSAWSEGVIDANIIGGQLKGETVKANIGNNLNIQSLQDSDNYDYKKLSTSVGASYTYGAGGAQVNASIGKTTMNSNWASVTDQSGIYAGKGGFDITVGNNTDLKGAVIASEAEDKTKNKLDTGTISFEDIKNKANYKVDSVNVNVGLGGGNGIGYTPSASAPSVYHNDGSDSSITKSAVEGGNLIVRDTDKQQQDVNDLSRDTENANDPLGQIFNKQKEQDRIDSLNLVKDITAQAKDVANKYSSINAELKYNAATEKEKEDFNKQAKEALERQGIKSPSEAEIRDQAINQIVQKDGVGNMGDSFSKGLDAASSIVSGIITGDITGGLAGASAPYLAEQIKKHTGHYDEASEDWVTDDKAANLVAHAILGGAVAAAQGNSALAGAGGAISGEAAVEYIKDFLYGEKTKISDLTQAQKENLSSLAQIASGLAVASVGGSTSDVGAAVSASKNAVENNGLSWGDGGNSMSVPIPPSTGENMDSILHANTLTREETIQAFEDLMKGKGMPNGSDYAELWMRAPEQIGQLLPGPVSAGMALLAATDVALTGTDKANLVYLLNQACGDYLSGSNNTESMTALNMMLNRLGVGNINNQFQGYIKDKVETNVNNTQKGNNASSFDEHAAKDNAPTVKDTTDGTLIFHENIGGHTITKHVGKSDAQLLARLESEKRLSAASSFSDDYTANKAIGDAIQANESQINSWLKNNDSRLVLQHDSNFVVGKVIQRGQTQSNISKSTIIVIDRDPLSPSGYRIQTAYPK